MPFHLLLCVCASRFEKEREKKIPNEFLQEYVIVNEKENEVDEKRQPQRIIEKVWPIDWNWNITFNERLQVELQ